MDLYFFWFVLLSCIKLTVSLPASYTPRTGTRRHDRLNLTEVQESTTLQERYQPEHVEVSPALLQRLKNYLDSSDFAKSFPYKVDVPRSSIMAAVNRKGHRRRRFKRHHPARAQPTLPKTNLVLVPITSRDGITRYLVLSNPKLVIDRSDTGTQQLAIPAPHDRVSLTPPAADSVASVSANFRSSLPGEQGVPRQLNGDVTVRTAGSNPWVITRIKENGSIRIERLKPKADSKSASNLPSARQQSPQAFDVVDQRVDMQNPITNGKTNRAGADITVGQTTRNGNSVQISAAREQQPIKKSNVIKPATASDPFASKTSKSRHKQASAGKVVGVSGFKTNVWDSTTPLPSSVVSDTPGPIQLPISVSPSTLSGSSFSGQKPTVPAGEPSVNVGSVVNQTLDNVTRPSKGTRKMINVELDTASGQQSKAAVASNKSLSIQVKTTKTVISGNKDVKTQKNHTFTPVAVRKTQSSTTPAPARTVVESPSRAITSTPTTTTTEEASEENIGITTPEEIEWEDILTTIQTTDAVTRAMIGQFGADNSGKDGKSPSVAGWATTESALGPLDRVNTTDVPEEIEPNERAGRSKNKQNVLPSSGASTGKPKTNVTVVINLPTKTTPSTEFPSSATTEEAEEMEVTRYPDWSFIDIDIDPWLWFW